MNGTPIYDCEFRFSFFQVEGLRLLAYCQYCHLRAPKFPYNLPV